MKPNKLKRKDPDSDDSIGSLSATKHESVPVKETVFDLINGETDMVVDEPNASPLLVCFAQNNYLFSLYKCPSELCEPKMASLMCVLAASPIGSLKESCITNITQFLVLRHMNLLTPGNLLQEDIGTMYIQKTPSSGFCFLTNPLGATSSVNKDSPMKILGEMRLQNNDKPHHLICMTGEPSTHYLADELTNGFLEKRKKIMDMAGETPLAKKLACLDLVVYMKKNFRVIRDRHMVIGPLESITIIKS